MRLKDIPVLLETDDFIAISKPSGIIVVPDRWDEEKETILDALKSEYPKLLVTHRIDRETSGVLLLAKTQEAHRALSMKFEERTMRKTYHAVVRGLPPWEETTVDLPLHPDADRAHRTTIDMTHGKPSITHFRALAMYKRFALIEARPETGRTHQIRVHLAHLGNPVVCDDLYGDPSPVRLSEFKKRFKGDADSERPLISRLALHAAALEFEWKGTALRIEAPYFKDMKALVHQLGKNA